MEEELEQFVEDAGDAGMTQPCPQASPVSPQQASTQQGTLKRGAAESDESCDFEFEGFDSDEDSLGGSSWHATVLKQVVTILVLQRFPIATFAEL
eukprot:g4404.t1